MRAQLRIPPLSRAGGKQSWDRGSVTGRVPAPAAELEAEASAMPAAPRTLCGAASGLLPILLPAAADSGPGTNSPRLPPLTRRGRWKRKGRGDRSGRGQQGAGCRQQKRPEPARARAATCPLRALSSGAFGSQNDLKDDKHTGRAGTRRGTNERKSFAEAPSLQGACQHCWVHRTSCTPNSSQSPLTAFESLCQKPLKHIMRERINCTGPLFLVAISSNKAPSERHMTITVKGFVWLVFQEAGNSEQIVWWWSLPWQN
ncbi:uncharacterized protein LOC120324436 [Pipra filicauda]|uniref:Uncharacterized protein LOC120324436 n=1 Tax=Pipra filicauda TaxID=649802 RepID=A0A7R5KR56_9PASS|nr:uncharacterized protein LOC120324436 [Pipra filicauda]